MGKYFLKFSFIGTLYRGLQKHSNRNILDNDSIQGAIETGLLTLYPKPVSKPRLYLTSRTDSGVHALYTIGHVTLENKYNVLYNSEEIIRQLNRFFGKTSHFIRILECIPVIDEFCSKKIVTSKTYTYRFMIAKKYGEQRIPIIETCHTYHVRSETFDIERMKQGTQLFMGLKDFRTFAAKSKKITNVKYVRNLNNLTIEKAQPLMPFDELSTNFDYWHIEISSRGFLYNQVRRIATALLGLATGNINEKDINTMLQVPSSENWNQQLKILPPHGLYLVKVDYDFDTLEKFTIKDKSNELNIDKYILGRRYEVVNGIKKELTQSLPFVLDEKPDMHIACIIHGLFLSSQDPAVSIEILKKYNIKHILSVGINLNLKFNSIEYYQCELLDLPESDIFLPVKTCINIIHQNRHENILVHCNAGVSRSPTIVISYLMALENLSYDEAYEKVKSKRNCIKPNSGFVQQLRKLNVSDLLV